MAELNARFSLEQRQIRANFSLEQTTIPAIFKINAAGTTWGSISGNIQNQGDLYSILQDKASVESVEILTETVQNNYDTLDGKIDDTESALAGQITAISNTVDINNQNINNRVDNVILDVSANTDAISTINNTISGYGNIVTHNVNEFATAAQGALADSALQPGDNISELNNDVGYITSASLPTVNNASLTIQRNGSQVAVFTANDSVNKTANILVPTQASDIGALPDTTTIADVTTQAQLDAINSGITSGDVSLIQSALQPNDNISELVNDAGYLQNSAEESSSLAIGDDITTNRGRYSVLLGDSTEGQSGTVALGYNASGTSNSIAIGYNSSASGDGTTAIGSASSATANYAIQLGYGTNSTANSLSVGFYNSYTTHYNWELLDGTTGLIPNARISSDIARTNQIPTVNNGTLDIQVNGTSIGTFTANQAGNTTANIVVPDSATWGNITGTLSNQIDLQNALDAKQDVISDLSTIRSGAALGATALQPNDNITELTNNAGYITGITSSDVTTALGYTPYNSTNPNGYISGITSLDVTPALGYSPLSNATKYGSSLSYSSNVLQLLDQDGNDLGSSVTIQSSPDIDNKSITENSNDELQTIGVIDQNNTTNAIKTWTGTKAQYDAIANKDANTLYNITDDTDVTLSLLELIYPVGSIYIGTMATCPLATLGVGTWQLVASDRVLQGAGTRGSVGSTVNESLPNVTGDTSVGRSSTLCWQVKKASGAFYNTGSFGGITETSSSSSTASGLGFDASRSSSTYQDNAPVQQDAYLVNIWERIN